MSDREAISELAQVTEAIRRYANHQPLDLKSPREIQRDLLSIVGDKHVHVSSIGSDACLICGRDVRHDVHTYEVCHE